MISTLTTTSKEQPRWTRKPRYGHILRIMSLLAPFILTGGLNQVKWHFIKCVMMMSGMMKTTSYKRLFMQSENGNFSKTVLELVEVSRYNGLTGQTEQAEAIYSPSCQKEALQLSNCMITEALVLQHSQKRYKHSSGILIFCLYQN